MMCGIHGKQLIVRVQALPDHNDERNIDHNEIATVTKFNSSRKSGASIQAFA